MLDLCKLEGWISPGWLYQQCSMNSHQSGFKLNYLNTNNVLVVFTKNVKFIFILNSSISFSSDVFMSLCGLDVSLKWDRTRGKGHVSLRSLHHCDTISFNAFSLLYQSYSNLTSVIAGGSQSYLKPQPVGRSQRQPQSSETGRPPQVWIILVSYIHSLEALMV